jgi:peptide-methionine (S)-S-oxide reductase
VKTINLIIIPIIAVLAVVTVIFSAQPLFSQDGETVSESVTEENAADNMEVATFAAGCFWSIEALYERLDGVALAESGYAGGSKENPTSEELSKGKFGYAEAVQITYDPKVVSYNELLEVFWIVHDPTTLNRQGEDVGRKYRSMILYHNEDQKRMAEESIIEASKDFDDSIVTEIVSLNAFYAAEEYNQDFYDNNKNSRYCKTVINPKIKKMKKLGLYDQ